MHLFFPLIANSNWPKPLPFNWKSIEIQTPFMDNFTRIDGCHLNVLYECCEYKIQIQKSVCVCVHITSQVIEIKFQLIFNSNGNGNWYSTINKLKSSFFFNSISIEWMVFEWIEWKLKFWELCFVSHFNWKLLLLLLH